MRRVTCLQTPTIFCLAGGTIFLRYCRATSAEPSAFEVEMATKKLERHKSPGIDQIPAELIKAGEEQFALRSVNLLFLSGIRRNSLRSGRNRSL